MTDFMILDLKTHLELGSMKVRHRLFNTVEIEPHPV